MDKHYEGSEVAVVRTHDAVGRPHFVAAIAEQNIHLTETQAKELAVGLLQTGWGGVL